MLATKTELRSAFKSNRRASERASGFDRRRDGMAKEAMMMMVVECAL